MTLDIAKGLAIIAIVVGHVLRGLGNAGIVAKEGAGYLLADRAIYSFHLAVFAVAAGLLVAGAVDRRGIGPYLRHRLVTFTWLYVLWSLPLGALQVVFSGSVNHEKDWATVLNLSQPQNHMWFFPWIAVCSLVVALWRPWLSRTRTVVAVLISVVVSLAAWGWFGPVIFLQGHGLTAFFVIAACVGLTGFQRVRGRLSMWHELPVFLAATMAWLLLVVMTPAAGPTYSKLERTVPNISVSVLATCLGVLAVFALSALLSRLRVVSEWLAYVGLHSLEIFLAHTLATAGVRIALSKIGLTDPMLHLLLGTMTGVVVPLALWLLTRRYLPWLWQAPKALTAGR
ncbi:acyltransferase [Schaalia sp. Marseille-Q2122]|uniref:acyltransferase family protein n=1 Tax=Schaalia sp. Marseille-Q2122 TaxID=2736604 RepID=UPI00158D2A0A|nr:acyltransferase [Schaalia sp. Marseille-Q2122]